MSPVAAHTDDQLDAWIADWEWRVWDTGELSWTLMMQHGDMELRHPCYFRDQCPPPKRTTPARTYSGGVEQWRSLVATYFRPGDVDRALRIMACESGGNPDAKNSRSSAAGLWQFLKSTWNRAAQSTGSPTYNQGGPYDPTWATINAAWLRDRGSGWNQWECN